MAESPQHGNFHLLGALSPSFSCLQLPLASSTCASSLPEHPPHSGVSSSVLSPPLSCQPRCPCHRPPSPSRRGHSALYAFTLLFITQQHPLPPTLESDLTSPSPLQCAPWMLVKGRKWGRGGLRKRRREACRVKDRPAILIELSDSLFTEKPKSL